MAFTLQQTINKKRVFLVKDFHIWHKPEPLHGEMVTFADSMISGPLMEGTSNQNDAITFKSFAQAKDFKKTFRLTNWDINFIANPKVTVKGEKKVTSSSKKHAFIKASAIPAFSI